MNISILDEKLIFFTFTGLLKQLDCSKNYNCSEFRKFNQKKWQNMEISVILNIFGKCLKICPKVKSLRESGECGNVFLWRIVKTCIEHQKIHFSWLNSSILLGPSLLNTLYGQIS